MSQPYKIFPIGDAAASIELGSYINEEVNAKVLAMRAWLSNHAIDGIKDIIVAYSSLTVYYDPIIMKKKNAISETVFGFIHQCLEMAFHESVLNEETESKTIQIPVCYSNGFGMDIDFVCAQKNISKQELVHLHSSRIYKVYMIGFLPGFSYLGTIDERLVMPRKQKPVMVEAGSVGIAASQTGIYPLNSPGGWQIIGRTPLQMFNPNLEQPVVLNVGDHVKFYEISKEEFENYPVLVN
ncbi:MAG: 5-oxoprolinase subunit PxpB [Bacteroidetes bacterium]|nr:5-oxoprolinase subunit PxpB [Bacteroidota bacterium]